MTDNNPITPPPELVQQWLTEPEYAGEMVSMTERRLQEIADKAALRGADRRLEQCVDWVNEYENDWLNGYEREGPAAEQMRNACRLKPKSQAEEALKAIGVPTKIGEARVIEHHAHELIRAALERLRELEKQADD